VEGEKESAPIAKKSKGQENITYGVAEGHGINGLDERREGERAWRKKLQEKCSPRRNTQRLGRKM